MVTKTKAKKHALALGWREWVYLPKLHLEPIKAKVDTGAKTSALHAFKVERFTYKRKDKVRFFMHPEQNDTNFVVKCVADIVDIRTVSDSSGHREKRFVIQTLMRLGQIEKDIELTLSNRETMRFRMLLGRSAFDKNTTIYPRKSFLAIRE